VKNPHRTDKAYYNQSVRICQLLFSIFFNFLFCLYFIK